jgi:hypothetical protein
VHLEGGGAIHEALHLEVEAVQRRQGVGSLFRECRRPGGANVVCSVRLEANLNIVRSISRTSGAIEVAIWMSSRMVRPEIPVCREASS